MKPARPQRHSRQRQVILEELRKLKTHPTAALLYEIARQRLPRLSLATVYRNLDLLARNGIVRKLDLAGGEARFDGDTGPHYHVRCHECGRVDDVHELPDEPTWHDVKKLSGYDIIGHRLEFIGVCPACLDARSPEGHETP